MLSGAQEVPAVATTASGEAELLLDTRTNMARWTVRYTGLSGPVSGAHLHGPAGPGRNAGVQVPISVPPAGGELRGQARLDPQQANELASGQWYVNLHTARHPEGEIRGQLRIQR